ncbi:MAG: PspC domain-containing protein [Arachnia sp.]
MPSLQTEGPSAPQLRRDPSCKAIAGVASGLAAHLNIPVSWTRLALVALVFLDGIGVLLYAALWLLMPAGTAGVRSPGLEAASRRGYRPRRSEAPVDAGIVVSLAMVLIGLFWVLATHGSLIPERMFWPLVLSAAGVAVIWLQVDRNGQRDPSSMTDSRWARFTRGSGVVSVLRLVGGLTLVVAGTSWLLATQIGMRELPMVFGAAVVLVAGVLVVAAPWLYRMRGRVRQADEERMRAEARADMAAHLHDSVLQTLALIQRQSVDSAAVASLARRQERELRSWLYGGQAQAQSLAGALEQVRTDTEANFDIIVEVICVGSWDLDDRGTALVQAAREAVTNAAKHSGASRIDVYAEVEDGLARVFVRDRGAGFDLDAVPEDRWGVRESINARMQRHAGTVQIRTAPGEGTEVRLEMTL